jgi:uncharacterized membrane protein (DUF2068 family)
MKKPQRGLWILIGIYLLNAVSTTIMYIRTLNPSYSSISFDPLTLRAYAVADFPFSVVPALVATYGLWRQRLWGWVLALMLNAVYFHSMTVIFAENLLKGQTSSMPDSMTPIAVYFILFGVASSLYLIVIRSQFLEVQHG